MSVRCNLEVSLHLTENSVCFARFTEYVLYKQYIRCGVGSGERGGANALFPRLLPSSALFLIGPFCPRRT